jgi:dihydroflavonol-4-reductase
MKILITGATGFIGSHLVDALAATDAEIFALVRDPARLPAESARRVRAIVGELADVPRLPVAPDLVYHLAGLTKTLNSKDYYTVNAKGTASLLDALDRQGHRPKVVVLSSVAAGGPSSWGGRRREGDPPEPMTPYGKSKLEGEREALARKDRFPIILLRPAAVYGPRDYDFLELFRTVERGIVLSIGFKKRLLSLCYVRDLVRALIRAAEVPLPSGEIVNIAEAAPHTMAEFGRLADTYMGGRARNIVLPMGVAYAGVLASQFLSTLARRPSPINKDKYRDYRQAGWVVDVEKSRDLLGFTADTPLEEGLRETIGWYLRNGWLSPLSGSRSGASRKSRKTSSTS